VKVVTPTIAQKDNKNKKKVVRIQEERKSVEVKTVEIQPSTDKNFKDLNNVKEPETITGDKKSKKKNKR
jgi:hypothetical protein